MNNIARINYYEDKIQTPDLIQYFLAMKGTEIYDYLQSIWFGDMACSSGKHGVKGIITPLEEILRQKLNLFSDDLIQNIAIVKLWEEISKNPKLKIYGFSNRKNLDVLRKRFVTLVKPYFIQNPAHYGVMFSKLVEHNNNSLKLTLYNRGCGAAMRAGALSFLDGSNTDSVTDMTAITHLHPEAVAGSFAVNRSIITAREKPDITQIFKRAIEGSQEGLNVSIRLIRSLGLEVPSHSDISKRIQLVLRSDDPYVAMENHKWNWTSAQFVVPAVLIVIKKSLDNESQLVSSIIQESYRIGGDPDTICSISMGLAYVLKPNQVLEQIHQLIEEYSLPNIESLKLQGE